METAMAVIHAEGDPEDRAAKCPAKPRASNRGSMPKHLPRIEEVIEPDGLAALAAVACIASAKMYRNGWTSSPSSSR